MDAHLCTSITVGQLLLFLVMLDIRVGADERSEEKDSAVPILGDLVVDLARNVFPETRHHLLLER